MTDFASLGLKIDSTQVKQGVTELDKLTAAGARAEAATLKLGTGSKAAAVGAAAMAAQAQASSRAAVSMGAGATAAATAMKSLGTHTRGSALQIRESLVLMREASVGNFTRMAGSASILAGSLATTGQSVGGLAKQLLTMVGILKVTQDAELSLAAADAAAGAAGIKAAADQAAAGIVAADTEVALAQAAVRVATTSEAAAAAQVELAAAHEAVAAAAAQATIAENAMAVAEGRAGEAAAASAAATTVALGPIAGILAGVAVAAGLVVGAFKTFQSQVRNDRTLDNYANSLGLTKKEMKELRQEVGGLSSKEMKDLDERARAFDITWGDVFHGLAKTASDALDLSPAWQNFKAGVADAFKSAANFALDAAAHMYGYWVGGYRTIVQTFTGLGPAIGSAFVAAVNAAITEINKLVKASVDGVNSFIGTINSVLHTSIGTLSAPQIGLVKDSYGKAGAAAGKSFAENVSEATAEAQKQTAKSVETIYANIIGAAEKRIKDSADRIIEDRTAKKPKKQSDHGLADALAVLDAQIKGQLRLAEAYQVSDQAAVKAEALQKAEEQAIRHKGQVGIFYEKELALAVSKAAAEGGKKIADLTAQAAAQKAVNDAVAAGTIPASQAEVMLKNEAELRPLIVAQSIAEGEAKDILTRTIARLRSEQAASNDEAERAQVLSAAAAGTDQLDRLKLEASLIGETNSVRAVAIAQLEAEQFLRDHPGASADEAKAYVETQKAIAQQTVDNATAQDNYNNSLSYMADLLELLDERAGILAGSLSDAFGNVGAGVGTAITALSHYAAVQAKLDHDHNAAVKAGTSTEKERALYEKASRNAQLQGTMQVVAGLKTMFKEHSAGYKAMEAAEKALAVIQLIQTAKSIAAGAAKMFAQLGVWAFPVVGAMIAVMAGLGFSGGSSSAKAPSSAEDVQAAQGAGTVLGDVSAKSDSIAHSLDLVAENTNKSLEYFNPMLHSLRSIDQNIGALAASVAKELGLGGAFDTTGKLGTSSKGISGLFGSTTTKSLYDQGLQFNSTSLADAIANGISGSTYQIIEKVKKKSGFLGIGGGTKTSYSTTTSPLDPDLERQVGLILGSLKDSVVQAAKVIGLDVSAALDTFQVEIGKISFKDMSADEISKTLENVFSKVADQMAGFAVDGLEQFQKAGEGLFETLTRLAKDYLTIDTSLKSIGLTFGAVGASSIAARESLIALFGTLDAFVEATSFYQQNFLTDAQQLAPVISAVQAEMTRLGLASVDTIPEFVNVVNGLDLTTTAGQELYAALMAVAPAFYQVEQAQEQAAQKAAEIAKQRTNLEIQLMEAQGNAAGALAKKRAMELAAMDESLRGLQQQVWLAQDVSKAKDNLVAAYKRERSELETTIKKFGDLSKSLRAFRDTLFGAGAGGTSYNAALAKLMATGGLARAGDEAALGDLQNVSKTFLDVAKDNAGSLQQYQRDVALVARYVDGGIAAAEGQMTTAEKQLAAMETQVSALVDINDSVLSVHDAILALYALQGGTSAPPAPSAPTGGVTRTPRVRGGNNEDKDQERNDRIERRLEEVSAATIQTATSINQLTRVVRTWDRGGSLAVATDDDTPLSTVVAV